MKLKVNDSVKVITGKDKGKTGKITKVLPKENKVIVSGVNKYKRHMKRRDNQTPGGVIEVERALHSNKVMLLVDGQVTRIGYTLTQSGDKIRVAKKTGEPIDKK
jgi:large subunit ribosomal protein L24